VKKSKRIAFEKGNLSQKVRDKLPFVIHIKHIKKKTKVFQWPHREVSGDPAGAQAPRRLQDLPVESECLERKSTGPFAGTK
jgi:hypothetical protein